MSDIHISDSTDLRIDLNAVKPFVPRQRKTVVWIEDNGVLRPATPTEASFVMNMPPQTSQFTIGGVQFMQGFIH